MTSLHLPSNTVLGFTRLNSNQLSFQPHTLTRKRWSTHSVSCLQSKNSGGATEIQENVSVTAVIAFGDSYVDSGNNNNLNSILKANFRPYGKDFMAGKPTGRFSNGKTLADFIVEALGLKEYLPAYLDPLILDKDLLTGVSFASAASGYDPLTPKLTNVIPLSGQLDMFKEYIWKLKVNVGEEEAKNIINNSLVLVAAGTIDLGINYTDVPVRRFQYNVPDYANMLVMMASNFIQEIYKLGVRKIGVFGALPIGSVPLQRTLAGGLRRMPVEKYNKDAQMFNTMLKQQLQFLDNTLPDSKVAFVDFYNPVLSIINDPQRYGFEVTDRGCCGTGLVEVSFLCNSLTPTCEDASRFLFWDSFHLTEKGNKIIIDLVLPDLVNSVF